MNNIIVHNENNEENNTETNDFARVAQDNFVDLQNSIHGDNSFTQRIAIKHTTWCIIFMQNNPKSK